MAEKVFISYSHQDGPCAHGIARYLKRHGCDVWIDSQNLSLGDRWASDIEEALRSCDCVVGILSSSSLRRDEVLKELSIALDRMEKEGTDQFRVFFVVIGQIHPSWFRNEESVQAIRKHLAQYQFIELSAYGEVTIDAMKKLLSALKRKGIEEGGTVKIRRNEENTFINQNAVPEKAFDNRGNNIWYKVYAADLSASTVFPFAMDNQWLPESFYDPSSSFYTEFEKYGFTSEKIQGYLEKWKEKNFLLPFFHFKQSLIRLSTILYDPYFRKILLSENEDRKAFESLLYDGSIVVLLSGEQMTPFIFTETKDEAISAWNQLCAKISVYCIRENWAAPIDSHSLAFLRFCSNMAMDHESNLHLAKAMGLKEEQINSFLVTLKTISMQAFCQTHMNGTTSQDKVDDYSRSLFYRNYIVKSGRNFGQDPVHACLFDESKPFHHELKRLVDICYNSLFCNTLQCDPLLPEDLRAENLYLHSLYLQSGEKEVSIEELQYAFSEFFDSFEILDEIEAIGTNLYLKNWNLEKISELRSKESWYEYVELLELINRRSNFWKVDFSELELLLKRFLRCFEESNEKPKVRDIAYSFRVMIGSRVLDIVKTSRVAKVKEYGGSYNDLRSIPLRVFFSIGDLSLEEREELIFVPVTLFNGRIDTNDSDGFFNRLKEFMIRQCGFISID